MENKEKKGSIFDSTIEAFQSFLRVPDTVTKSGSHVRDCNDLKRVMIIVVVALIPTLLFGIYNIGYQHSIASGTEMGFWQMVWFGFLKILPLYLVSYIVGLGIEFASAGNESYSHQCHERNSQQDPSHQPELSGRCPVSRLHDVRVFHSC